MKRILLIVAIAIFSISFLAACSSDDKNKDDEKTESKADTTTTAGVSGTEVQVSLKEFAILVDPDSIGTGDMTFIVNNDGLIEHEFVVFKTDLAPDALPVDKDNNVDEEGDGVEFVDELEDLGKDTTTNLPLKLDSGSYVVFCNIEGHYASGMNAAFSVK